MTSSQFAEWLTFSAIEPVGREYRNELRHGQVMQLLDAANFKRDKPATVADFMNFQEKPEVKELDLSDEQVQAKIDKEAFGL